MLSRGATPSPRERAPILRDAHRVSPPRGDARHARVLRGLDRRPRSIALPVGARAAPQLAVPVRAPRHHTLRGDGDGKVPSRGEARDPTYTRDASRRREKRDVRGDVRVRAEAELIKSRLAPRPRATDVVHARRVRHPDARLANRHPRVRERANESRDGFGGRSRPESPSSGGVVAVAEDAFLGGAPRVRRALGRDGDGMARTRGDGDDRTGAGVSGGVRGERGDPRGGGDDARGVGADAALAGVVPPEGPEFAAGGDAQSVVVSRGHGHDRVVVGEAVDGGEDGDEGRGRGMAELRVVVETAGVRAPVGAHHGGVRATGGGVEDVHAGGQAGHLAEAIGAQAETGGAGAGAAVAKPAVVAAAARHRDRRHASARGGVEGGDRGGGEARRGNAKRGRRGDERQPRRGQRGACGTTRRERRRGCRHDTDADGTRQVGVTRRANDMMTRRRARFAAEGS